MARDLPSMLDEIDALLEAPDLRVHGLETMEQTLTKGYAHALAIEGERGRLERELGATAVLLEENAGPEVARLSEVARRVAALTEELGRLRTKLAALRTLTSEARAAVV